LLLKLTTVLEITRESEGVKVNIEARQRLLSAVSVSFGLHGYEHGLFQPLNSLLF
jgi:hypothetical protein